MILECTLTLFSFTICLHWTEYTHKLGGGGGGRRCETESYNQKLKQTLPVWAYYKPILVSSLFNPLHFVCVFSLFLSLPSLSLSLHTIFFPTTALHKHEKGSCSAISAIQATRDHGFNQKTISGLDIFQINVRSVRWQKWVTELVT